LPDALSRSAIETCEVTAADIINNGFSTTGYDGVVLFSTAHVNLDGSTWANTPATQADLSLTSLSAGLTAIDKYVDEQGLKRPTVGKLLAVPSDGWMIAEELLSSEFKPYVANNEVNALQKKDLQYLVWKYLTDADSWFLFAEKSQTMLKFFWRVRPGALRKGNDFDTTNLKHLSRMRFSCGYSHAMGTYGSSGA